MTPSFHLKSYEFIIQIHFLTLSLVQLLLAHEYEANNIFMPILINLILLLCMISFATTWRTSQKYLLL